MSTKHQMDAPSRIPRPKSHSHLRSQSTSTLPPLGLPKQPSLIRKPSISLRASDRPVSSQGIQAVKSNVRVATIPELLSLDDDDHLSSPPRPRRLFVSTASASASASQGNDTPTKTRVMGGGGKKIMLFRSMMVLPKVKIDAATPVKAKLSVSNKVKALPTTLAARTHQAQASRLSADVEKGPQPLTSKRVISSASSTGFNQEQAKKTAAPVSAVKPRLPVPLVRGATIAHSSPAASRQTTESVKTPSIFRTRPAALGIAVAVADTPLLPRLPFKSLRSISKMDMIADASFSFEADSMELAESQEDVRAALKASETALSLMKFERDEARGAEIALRAAIKAREWVEVEIAIQQELQRLDEYKRELRTFKDVVGSAAAAASSGSSVSGGAASL